MEQAPVNDYQVILKIPAIIGLENLSPMFSAMIKALGITSLSRLPGTIDYNNEKLIGLEMDSMEGMADVLGIISVGLTAVLATPWSIFAAQTKTRLPQFNVEGTPLMEVAYVDKGGSDVMAQVTAVNVHTALDRTAYANFVAEPVADEFGVIPAKNLNPATQEGAEAW